MEIRTPASVSKGLGGVIARDERPDEGLADPIAAIHGCLLHITQGSITFRLVQSNISAKSKKGDEPTRSRELRRAVFPEKSILKKCFLSASTD